jgi:CubicO group peptidase (beta-lactamase class C family)
MRIPALLFAIATLVAWGTPAHSQARPAMAAAAAPQLDRADLDAWLDGLVPGAMKAGKIPGGVVVVVKDGQILTERGFGYADVAARRKVDPRTTIFHPGSISKALTFTAVMQLVEQGRIDLDADVNRYLDFRIPPRDGKPVTMRNIMTHTSGFEESLRNLTTGARLPPQLGPYLKSWVPRRIFPAGTVPAYSNYASTLAGYVVERVSGQSFDDYMDRNVLGALGMGSASFRQPVPARLRPWLARGYAPGSDAARHDEYFGAAPAGSLVTTGHDMASFMIAHLQQGRFGTGRILAPATAAQMHSIQPRIFPALHGMALGFYEHSRNGRFILAHNGGTQYFHSDMHLFMNEGVGIFISLNSPGENAAASGLHEALFHGFADRYFPAASDRRPPTLDRATALRHAQLMAGNWDSARRADSNMFRLTSLIGPLVITANADGTISFPIPRQGITSWREVAPFVWQDVDGPDRIQALVKDGRPVMLGLDMAPPQAFQPAPAGRSPSWVMPALLAAIATLLIAGIAWPIGAVARRRSGAAAALTGRVAWVRRAARGTALGAVAMIFVVIGTIVHMSGDLARFSDAMDGWLLVVKLAALILFAGAFASSAYELVLRWRPSGWPTRLRVLLVTASCAMLLWTGFVFNLFNLGAHY